MRVLSICVQILVQSLHKVQHIQHDLYKVLNQKSALIDFPSTSSTMHGSIIDFAKNEALLFSLDTHMINLKPFLVIWSPLQLWLAVKSSTKWLWKRLSNKDSSLHALYWWHEFTLLWAASLFQQQVPLKLGQHSVTRHIDLQDLLYRADSLANTGEGNLTVY